MIAGLSSGVVDLSATVTSDGVPSFGVRVTLAPLSCFGTSAVKSPFASDVALPISFPSLSVITTSVFGFVFPLTVVVVFVGSFSALPSVIAGFSSGAFTATFASTLSVEPSL